MRIEPGKHQVELSFFPQTVKNTETVAYVALIIMALLLLAAIGFGLKKRKTIEG